MYGRGLSYSDASEHIQEMCASQLLVRPMYYFVDKIKWPIFYLKIYSTNIFTKDTYSYELHTSKNNGCGN